MANLPDNNVALSSNSGLMRNQNDAISKQIIRINAALLAPYFGKEKRADYVRKLQMRKLELYELLLNNKLENH